MPPVIFFLLDTSVLSVFFNPLIFPFRYVLRKDGIKPYIPYNQFFTKLYEERNGFSYETEK